MKKFIRDWYWAYRKIRTWQCWPWTAAYRGLLYALHGNSGYFFSHGGKRKSCIYGEQ